MGALSSSKCFRPFLLPGMVLGQAARASAEGSLGEMRVSGPHPRTSRVGGICVRTSPRSEHGDAEEAHFQSPVLSVQSQVQSPQVPVKCLLLCATVFGVFPKPAGLGPNSSHLQIKWQSSGATKKENTVFQAVQPP